MESGEHDECYRLLGAYQGIALGYARRAAARYEGGPVHEMTSRYERGDVILQPLKEGYYLVLVLAAGASLTLGRHLMRPAQARMNQEL
jgi:predicted regulator of Ras-like GTPase activity (Roadblock/LC7/MglB family)